MRPHKTSWASDLHLAELTDLLVSASAKEGIRLGALVIEPGFFGGRGLAMRLVRREESEPAIQLLLPLDGTLDGLPDRHLQVLDQPRL